MTSSFKHSISIPIRNNHTEQQLSLQLNTDDEALVQQIQEQLNKEIPIKQRKPKTKIICECGHYISEKIINRIERLENKIELLLMK